jgi:hypothetical protein
LEGANASDNNMDKDGGQVIHEEHMIKDHEQRKANYPLNYPGDCLLHMMIILWLDINMNH